MRDSDIVCVCVCVCVRVCVCGHKRKSIVVNVQIHNGTAGRLSLEFSVTIGVESKCGRNYPDPAPGKRNAYHLGEKWPLLSES